MFVKNITSVAINPQKVAAMMKRIHRNQMLAAARQKGLTLGPGDTLYKAIHGVTMAERYSKKV